MRRARCEESRNSMTSTAMPYMRIQSLSRLWLASCAIPAAMDDPLSAVNASSKRSEGGISIQCQSITAMIVSISTKRELPTDLSALAFHNSGSGEWRRAFGRCQERLVCEEPKTKNITAGISSVSAEPISRQCRRWRRASQLDCRMSVRNKQPGGSGTV